MPQIPDDLDALKAAAAREGELALERLRRSDVAPFTEAELAERWRLSVRTLQRWRADGSGPVFLRPGRRIAYRRLDVERFEAARATAGDRS